MSKPQKWIKPMGHKDWHVYVPDDLSERVEGIRARMSPKPTRNALMLHILELWADTEIGSHVRPGGSSR